MDPSAQLAELDELSFPIAGVRLDQGQLRVPRNIGGEVLHPVIGKLCRITKSSESEGLFNGEYSLMNRGALFEYSDTPHLNNAHLVPLVGDLYLGDAPLNAEALFHLGIRRICYNNQVQRAVKSFNLHHAEIVGYRVGGRGFFIPGKIELKFRSSETGGLRLVHPEESSSILITAVGEYFKGIGGPYLFHTMPAFKGAYIAHGKAIGVTGPTTDWCTAITEHGDALCFRKEYAKNPPVGIILDIQRDLFATDPCGGLSLQSAQFEYALDHQLLGLGARLGRLSVEVIPLTTAAAFAKGKIASSQVGETELAILRSIVFDDSRRLSYILAEEENDRYYLKQQELMLELYPSLPYGAAVEKYIDCVADNIAHNIPIVVSAGFTLTIDQNGIVNLSLLGKIVDSPNFVLASNPYKYGALIINWGNVLVEVCKAFDLSNERIKRRLQVFAEKVLGTNLDPFLIAMLHNEPVDVFPLRIASRFVLIRLIMERHQIAFADLAESTNSDAWVRRWFQEFFDLVESPTLAGGEKGLRIEHPHEVQPPDFQSKFAQTFQLETALIAHIRCLAPKLSDSNQFGQISIPE